MKKATNHHKSIQNNFLYLNNLSISMQISFIIILLTLFMLIQGFFSLQSLNKTNTSSINIYEKTTNGTMEATLFKVTLQKIALQYAYGTSGNPNSQKMNELLTTLKKQLEVLIELFPNETSLASTKDQVERLIMYVKNSSNPYTIQALNKIDLRSQLILDEYNSFESAWRLKGLEELKNNKKIFQETKTQIFIIILIGILLSVSFGFLIVKSLGNSLQKISQVAIALSSGDLTKKINLYGKNEICKMSYAFNQAIDNLKELVNRINEESKNLNSASNNILFIADETGKSTKEVVLSINNINLSNLQQNQVVNQITDKIRENIHFNINISKEAENLFIYSSQIPEYISNGQNVSNNVLQTLENITNSSSQISQSFEELNQLNKQISDMMSLIENIHSQTTLLSLNASIEAARTGISGMGFAIIAEEMIKLSESSRQTALKVNRHIKKILESTEKTHKLIEDEQTHVELGKKLINDSDLTFQKLFDFIGFFVSKIEKFGSLSQNMKETNESTLNNINQILDYIETNSAGIEEIATSTQQQLIQIEEVTNSSTHLRTTAINLNHEVEKFKFSNVA